MKNIGIAIPTLNRELYLTELLKSIPDTFTTFVSDNGSFCSEGFKQKNESVDFFSHSSVISMYENWNFASKNIADVEYLAITSDDDYYQPDGLSVVSRIINDHDADIYIFGNYFVDEIGSVTGSYVPQKFEVFEAPLGITPFLYGVEVRTPSVFFKKSFLDRIGYLDTGKFSVTAADSELIQRALLLGRAVYVPEIVSSYRIWTNNLTSLTIATKPWIEDVAAWAEKISEIMLAETCAELKVDVNEYIDEIVSSNAVAGMNQLLLTKNVRNGREYLAMLRFPLNAKFRSKLRYLKFRTLVLIYGLLGW